MTNFKSINAGKIMHPDLETLLSQVVDERSFRIFLDALATDFAEGRDIEVFQPTNPFGTGALGWEHKSIDGFLGAAAAVGIDRAMVDLRGDANNPWHICAAILYGAKHYE
ncbi:DUF7660 family protein [Comamonas sp. 23]|uniref:DUF7660 family protein n=1 Tax=Comamonas sp. 23 TaxID=3415008 RepID=UPI003C6EEEAF